MKHLILFLLLCSTSFAQSIKISGLSPLTTPASGDRIPIVDVSDTTQAASGSTKYITWANMFSGYAGGNGITTLGTVATGTWSATAIAVDKGGTGQTSYTNGQIMIGNTTGNTLTKATLTGTAGQITVTNGAGSITLSLPANLDLALHTLSEPTIEAPVITGASMTDTTFNDALALFSGASPTPGVGGLVFDNNAWAASRGAVAVSDGTASTFVIATLASDTPTNGQVPTWNTGGTITWETPGAASFDEAGDYTLTGTWDFTAATVTYGTVTTTTLVASVLDLGAGSLEIPNGTSDVALAAGQIHLNTTDEQLSVHSAADGEISGEVAIPLIQHRMWSFDPDAVCDGAVDRLFLMTVGDDAPEGIVITEWKVSFEADPTTEVDLDFKRADAFIGVANSAVVDVLDTTAGVSSEDTNANINGGAAVANGKVLYLEFGTAYTESNHQIIFEVWYYSEED